MGLGYVWIRRLLGISFLMNSITGLVLDASLPTENILGPQLTHAATNNELWRLPCLVSGDTMAVCKEILTEPLVGNL